MKQKNLTLIAHAARLMAIVSACLVAEIVVGSAAEAASGPNFVEVVVDFPRFSRRLLGYNCT